ELGQGVVHDQLRHNVVLALAVAHLGAFGDDQPGLDEAASHGHCADQIEHGGQLPAGSLALCLQSPHTGETDLRQGELDPGRALASQLFFGVTDARDHSELRSVRTTPAGGAFLAVAAALVATLSPQLGPLTYSSGNDEHIDRVGLGVQLELVARIGKVVVP